MPDDGSNEPGRCVGMGEREARCALVSRGLLVANWATHRILPRLFADWTALMLPPDWSAMGRWVAVGVASGATLASRDLAGAKRFAASLDTDGRRSDRLYRGLVDAFNAAENQGRAAPVRARAAAKVLLRVRASDSPESEHVLRERGIEGLYALAAASIAWGVRSYIEGSMMAGLLLAFSPRQHRMLQEFVLGRLAHLVQRGGIDDRPLVLAVMEDSYPNTHIQRATLMAAAKRILQDLGWIVCRSNVSWWVDGAYRAGARLARQRPKRATDLIMELLRVIGPRVYEEQLQFSDEVSGCGHHDDGTIDANPGVFELVRTRWPWLLEGDCFGHECILWGHVFDQAFWAGMLHECRRREILPSKQTVDGFRRSEV